MTLNQQYKASNSNKPFKEWLFDLQKKGEIDIKSKDMKEYKNANGEAVGFSFLGIPMSVWLLGTLAVVGGIWAYKKYAK